MKHLPWFADELGFIRDSDHYIVANPLLLDRSAREIKESTKVILEAVNNHDKLVQTLRRLTNSIEFHGHRDYGDVRVVIDSANSLLKKLGAEK